MTTTISRSMKLIHFHKVEGLFDISLLDVKVLSMFKITLQLLGLIIKVKNVQTKKKKGEV